MKDVFTRWAKTIGCAAFLGAMVATSTGCGALGAAANPKVAWALNDPAPMSVVVRRADVAEKTAQNVDRVLTDTPANDDSPWLSKVGPSQDDAAKQLADLRGTSYYQQGARVVPAEVWAKSLADIEPKNKIAAKAATPAAAPAPAVAAAPAKEPAKEPEPAPAPASDQPAVVEPTPEPVVKAATPAVKPEKGGKGRGKGGKPAKVAVAPKPVVASNKKGARGKTAPVADNKMLSEKPLSATPPPPPPPAPSVPSTDAPAQATASAAKPAPAPTPAPVSTTTTTSADVPAPAAAPAASTSASTAKYPSLLAAIDKDLAAAWSVVIEKKKAIGDVKGQIATEEAALDVKGISDADKKAHKKTIDTLEKQLSKLEKEADKLTSDFVPQAKAAAKKAPAEVREKFGAVLVNLQKAVDDANIANGAAAVRYPMAATSMGDSAQQMASIYVADVIEEKTGKRPAAGGFQPNVSLQGTDVKLTINGLSQQDLGKISMTELTTEVTARTTNWVKHALGLLGTISSTKELLSFEDDVPSALIDGFKSNGWNAPAAATIPDAPAAAGAPRS